MDCSIIIVSWNVRDELDRCLRAVFQTASDASYDVWVVDNASTDGTTTLVREKYPQVHLIANTENKGFAAACNQAMSQATGQTVLLLNPDTEVQPNTLERVLQVLRSQPSVGIVGCHLVNSDGSTQPSVRRFPDLGSHLMIMLKLHHLFPRVSVLRHYREEGFDYSKPQVVDQVEGAFFLIRGEVIHDLGLLDDGFYIWYEEVDYCKRARSAGWKTYYTSAATCLHQGGASFRKRLPLDLQRIFNRSMLRYFKKHGTVSARVVLTILYPISLCLAFIQQVFTISRYHSH